MTGWPVLRPGDRVSFDNDEHQVVGLSGTAVRLRSDSGAEQLVLAGHLIASPDFAVLDAAPAPVIDKFGLLDALPEDVLAAARWLACAGCCTTCSAPAWTTSAAVGTTTRG
jgi:putative transposase